MTGGGAERLDGAGGRSAPQVRQDRQHPAVVVVGRGLAIANTLVMATAGRRRDFAGERPDAGRRGGRVHGAREHIGHLDGGQPGCQPRRQVRVRAGGVRGPQLGERELPAGTAAASATDGATTPPATAAGHSLDDRPA
ncbi:hypothetical protein OG871_35265 [Kitasatospora sp. NBC_00374]|uniref:hypothetical protein n=1 Tax=Kitasatospora sp. NBC_00374 TaxID=2975964 RepID=UPI0030DE4659